MVAQVIAWWWKRRRALQGRDSCIAQGASPGLIVSTHFLSSAGAALSQQMQVHEPQRHKSNARCECRSYGAQSALSVYTQGFISGFALITPWAKQEYRAYGTRKSEV